MQLRASQRILLAKQLEIMQAYAGVLAQRLADIAITYADKNEGDTEK